MSAKETKYSIIKNHKYKMGGGIEDE